ncbi:unnamed protein product [Mesocestoides corti]|uniref:Unconventional prefoldin RPB5 interactor 1 n=1 Tax=Mesocestoides corti TaxID=53468 RepID=A0A0R3U6W6_MESCO|nr:unnamed protein product [Mesocestoides corti]
MERFDRLLVEQQQAIQQTTSRVQQLRKYTADYMQLKLKLETASKCLSKKALIPFSPRALVPARLIHTNEVLIYLGGNAEHFCEASTFQTLSIIDKRVERIQGEIKRLEEQHRLLADREAFTRRLVKGEQPHSVFDNNIDGEGEKEFEIREEYDPEKEKVWQANHKRRVNDEREQRRAAAQITSICSRTEKSQVGTPLKDSYYLPDIVILHSDNPALPVNANITDWRSASPADVVAYTKKEHAKSRPPAHLKSGANCEEKTPSTQTGDSVLSCGDIARETTSSLSSYSRVAPFSDVTEHEPISSEKPKHEEKTDGLVSKFRLRRDQKT